jgi:hypothetical protein
LVVKRATRQVPELERIVSKLDRSLVVEKAGKARDEIECELPRPPVTANDTARSGQALVVVCALRRADSGAWFGKRSGR